MSGSDTILSARDGPVGLVTINRPEARNAMDVATVRRLGEAVAAAEADETIRAIVVTGAGDIAFSAGGDMKEMRGTSALGSDRDTRPWQETLGRIERAGIPVIAAVNGYAFGGGTELAMACHIRLCSDNAQFGQTEIRHDHLPGAGGTQRLPRLIPLSAAYELLLTGDALSAADALRLGLVSRVTTRENLLPEAIGLARRIAARSRVVVQYTLEAIREGLAGPLEQGLRLERALAALVMESAEAQQGLKTFAGRSGT
jgi:enoyl-CoA hydratase